MREATMSMRFLKFITWEGFQQQATGFAASSEWL
jgi:hypothetical protein